MADPLQDEDGERQLKRYRIPEGHLPFMSPPGAQSRWLPAPLVDMRLGIEETVLWQAGWRHSGRPIMQVQFSNRGRMRSRQNWLGRPEITTWHGFWRHQDFGMLEVAFRYELPSRMLANQQLLWSVEDEVYYAMDATNTTSEMDVISVINAMIVVDALFVAGAKEATDSQMQWMPCMLLI